jgi:DNA invertase Pin-like site-specific DNA recombinase
VSLESQLEGGRAYARQRGWKVVGEYTEPKTSGFHEKLGKRPQGRRLLDDIEAGKVDVVIVRHVDRLSRWTDVLTIREGAHIATYDQASTRRAATGWRSASRP